MILKSKDKIDNMDKDNMDKNNTMDNWNPF